MGEAFKTREALSGRFPGEGKGTGHRSAGAHLGIREHPGPLWLEVGEQEEYGRP